jgi:hypothetical protein
MTRAVRHPVGWAPLFVVGISAAVAAEVAVALLLYSGPGFTRSLTTLLTVEALALAAGLRFPALPPEAVDGLRRRWLLALMSFLAATVFGTAWTLVPDMGSGRAAQGLGLALLAALPLYACGALFSGLAGEYREAEGRSRDHGTASVSALGAALGFALTGFLLPRAPTPSSLLVGCLILLSLGGMAYAAVRGARPRRRIIAEGCVGPPPVRVEERVPAGAEWTEWVLLEGAVVRATRRFRQDGGAEVGPADASDVSWDVRVLRELAPESGRRWRALFVGGGASTAPSEAVRLGAEAVVLERAHCVVDLGRSRFHTGLDQVAGPGAHGDPARPTVLVGNMEDALRELSGPFDIVMVDGRALDPVGSTTALSRWAREELGRMLAEGGAMAWGPKAAHHPRDYVEPDWTTLRRDLGDPLQEVLVVRRPPDVQAVTAVADGGSASSS